MRDGNESSDASTEAATAAGGGGGDKGKGESGEQHCIHPGRTLQERPSSILLLVEYTTWDAKE